jgi:hypothetical protein
MRDVPIQPTPAYQDALGRIRRDQGWQVIDQIGAVQATLPTKAECMALAAAGARFSSAKVLSDPFSPILMMWPSQEDREAVTAFGGAKGPPAALRRAPQGRCVAGKARRLIWLRGLPPTIP